MSSRLCIALLLVAGVARGEETPSPAPAAAERVARFAFQTLGGRRSLLERGGNFYFPGPENELWIAPKPAGGEIPRETPAPIGKLKLKGVPNLFEWVGDGLLCIATGLHLAFVDVADPKSPRIVREVAVADTETRGVGDFRRWRGGLLLAARRRGLVGLDLEDRTRVKVNAELELPGMAQGLDFDGERIAVATGTGIALVAPTLGGLKLEHFIDTFRDAGVVRLLGKRLVFASKEYLVFLDITDPKSPTVIAEISTVDPFFNTWHVDLRVKDGRVYTASTEGGVYVYDWRDAQAPRTLLQYSFWANQHAVTPEKKLQYLHSIGFQGSAADLDPFIAKAENLHVAAVGLHVEGDKVYAVDWKGQLWCLAIETGAKPAVRCLMRPPAK